MSTPSRYNLRSHQESNSDTQSDNEEDSIFNNTIMEGNITLTQPIPATNQMATLIANLNALSGSIAELQKSSTDNQRELATLRQQIQFPNGGTAITQMEARESSTPETERGAAAIVPIQQVPMNKIYDLPTFSGNPEEWPLFYANFNDSTEAFNYSKRQNLMRLQKCLTGLARETVTSLLIYPDDVPNAIKELEFRFGRPDLLIRAQLVKVQQFPAINEYRMDQIIVFSTKVRNMVAFLKSTKSEQHMANPALLETLVSKLPQNNQFEWARRAVGIQPYPTISDFSDWVSELANIVCLMPPTTTSRSIVQPRRMLHVEDTTPNETRSCLQCGGHHFIANCKKFGQALTPKDRWKKVKELQLCFSCLHKGHRSTTCRFKRTCGRNGCVRQHHELLHLEKESQAQSINNTTSVLNCRAPQRVSTQMFKILPVAIYGPKGKAEVFAMFDEGSAISMIEDSVAKELGLKGQVEPLMLQWFGDKVTTEPSAKVSLEIAENDDTPRFAVKNIRTIKNLNLPEQSFNKSLYSHFDLLPIKDYQNIRPSILLGLDYVHLGVSSTVLADEHHNPVAIKTKLGWVAYGPTQNLDSARPVVLHIRQHSMSKLHATVAEYFATENFGTSETTEILESEEEKIARKIMQDTTKFADNKYEIGLLWKHCPPNFPDNFESAKGRLLGIEKKMQRDPNFATKYREEINKYLNKGYARKITGRELLSVGHPVWYLPHFGVQTVHKPDKLRIVFDAAAETAGTSLNSKLLKGPEQAKSLLGILFKFREGAVGVAADIREMFSQVNIRPADQHAQRFLWRNGDQSQPIQHYAMTTMIFGAICSPCCAEFIKNQHAEKFKVQFPDAASAIINKHYVDDFVCSFECRQTAEVICKQVVAIHKEAGFELRSFVSNATQLQQTMNLGADGPSAVNMERQATTEKVLGMYWHTLSDTFKFETKFHRISPQVLQGSRPPTKRELLGIIMAIFDPYGLLSNFVIFAKVLVQETWKQNIQWDEPIPAGLQKKWDAWWSEFKKVQNFEIQRCYAPNISSCLQVELHMFVDASQAAFAAVGYFRFRYADEVKTAFVCGKTRTAPQKLMSIPRLELQAAVLGVRLSKVICGNHDQKIARVTFWSDSQTVLQWINSVNRKYKPFVGHRIAEILRSSEASQWRWTPTVNNAADAATRPKFPPKFETRSIWTVGPDFLKQPEELWPAAKLEIPKLSPEEIQPCFTLQQASDKFIKYTNFSSFMKLKRTMAWVLRFRALLLQARRESLKVSKGMLTMTEINEAEITICRMVQQEEYAEDIATLRESRAITKQSSLYSLSPYLAEDGLLRVSGRLDEAVCLPFSARRPIILPQKHPVTILIVRFYHEKMHHQNVALTINEIRQKFWVPHARTVLKTIQRQCVTCKISSARPTPPLMGQLPTDRVTPYVRPFTYTGVDLFGPLNVAVGRRREKRWGVIFTCLTIRAAHIELADSLSTDAFILCLRNFINRRGTPLKIRSDNGTNFIGVQKDLKAADCLLDIGKINDEATKRGIEWVFNCPANPSSGGCWERLIRVIKNLLNKTLKEVAPRVETLQSVLIEAESIINSRPLTDLPLSSADDEPLTPNHFLLGCLNATQTPHSEDTKICLRKQWRIAQNLKDRLWKRWTIEYLPQLLRRVKWHEKTNPLKVDDLVIICEPNQPRNHWQKGLITKVFPSKDGHIRSAEVRTATGVLRRPTSRLATLNLEGESPRNSRGRSVSERAL